MIVQDQNVIGHKLISGVTPDSVISQIKELPILYQQWKLNTDQNQRFLVDGFMRMPSKADCPGYIYGFREKDGYDSSDTNYWIKMGRTNRATPQTRITEWQKTDKHQYNEIFTVRSEHNSKLELIVHLIFAYARKHRQINGCRRIEWFYFDKNEKIATAAITNMANILMEKIHEKHLYNNRVQEIQTVSPLYNQLIEELSNKYQLKNQDFIIVTFGLPKTGKSTLSSLIFNDEVQVKKSDRCCKISTTVKDQQKNFIEVTQSDPLAKPRQNMKQYFFTWQKLAHTKKILPILTIKQSDIESSKMVGLIQGLNLLQKYVRPTKLLIAVSQCSKTFTSEQAKEIIIQNREFLNEEQLKLLATSQFILIKKPENSGPLVSTTELLFLRQKIIGWTQQLQKNESLWGRIEFKLEERLDSLCHEVIQKSYVVLQPLLADKFKERYQQYIDMSLKIEFIVSMTRLLTNLKNTEQQDQQTIHQIFGQLGRWLQLSQKEQMQVYVYCFCEISANKNMLYSSIMTLLEDQVSQKTLEIKDTYLIRLEQLLEPFKKAIATFKKNGKVQIINLLVQIYETKTLTDMIGVVSQIIEQGSNINEKEAKQLVTIASELSDHLKAIDEIVLLGFRLDSALGKVREYIYYGLKQQQYQIPKTQPFSLQKESPVKKEVSSKSQLFIDYIQENTKSISVLQKKIGDYAEGTCIVNSSDQFSFQGTPKTQSIRHYIIILAKQIKIYESVTISFKGLQDKKKLKFIVVSQSYINITKLSLPEKSQNGHAYLFHFKEGQMTKLHSPKNDQLPEGAEQTLKKLYKSSLG